MHTQGWGTGVAAAARFGVSRSGVVREKRALTWLNLDCLVQPPGLQPYRKQGCLKGQITYIFVLLGLGQDHFPEGKAWGRLLR